MRACRWMAVALLLAGCVAQPQGLYYWSEYTESLYDYKKDPTPEMLDRHLAMLREIIATSGERGQRVPPGIYAELGYFLAQTGETGEALEMFRQEEQVWPESGLLMERLVTRLAPEAAKAGGAP